MEKNFAQKIREIGNSKGVLIPTNIISDMKLKDEEEVVVSIQKIIKTNDKGIQLFYKDAVEMEQLIVKCPCCSNVENWLCPAEDLQQNMSYECPNCNNKSVIKLSFFIYPKEAKK